MVLYGNNKESHHIWAAARQNQQNDPCAQQRLRSALASAQSDQSLLAVCGLIRLCFTGRAGYFVGFVVLQLILQMCKLIWVFAICRLVDFAVLQLSNKIIFKNLFQLWDHLKIIYAAFNSAFKIWLKLLHLTFCPPSPSFVDFCSWEIC